MVRVSKKFFETLIDTITEFVLFLFYADYRFEKLTVQI